MAGTFNFTITAGDADGCRGSRPYSIVIAAPGCPVITLTPGTLAPGVTGSAYAQSVAGTGGTAPYTYLVSSGALPTGLTLNPATGVISGVPLQPGLFSFTIRPTDARGCTGAHPYTVTISAATVTGIPTLDPLSLILLSALLAAVGVFVASRS